MRNIRSEFALYRERACLSLQDVADRTGYSLRSVYRWDNGEVKPRRPVLEKMKGLAEAGCVGKPERPSFRFIDLFAGIGGMRLAFEGVGGECVFTSEWNKYSRQTYQANFSCDHMVVGDITEYTSDDRIEEIPEHDVLLAGFPCQPFSIAGVSKKNALGREHGFKCQTQGTLFFHIARILEHHRPAAFLLENVANLARHDKGRTFKIIQETLDELGYSYKWRIIDAKRFVPQHRERIFIAGFRTETDFDFESLILPAKGPRLGSIFHSQNGSEEAEPPYTVGPKAKVNEKYTLTEHLWQYLQDYAAKHKAKGNGFGFGLVGPDDVARTLSARYFKDGSEILIAQPGDRPRRLTPRECARLMGFDLPNRRTFEIPVSDTQAYKQFGNAVVVPVVEEIAKFMLPYIIQSMESDWQQLELPFNIIDKIQEEAVYG